MLRWSNCFAWLRFWTAYENWGRTAKWSKPEFQLSSLGMKGCDNHCHPNQPRVRHASSANSTQISAKSIFIHAAHSRQFYKISTKVLQKLCRRVYDGSGLTELDESYEKFLHFYVRSKGLKHCPDKALLLYNWTSWLSTCAFKWSDSVWIWLHHPNILMGHHE